MVGGKHPFFYPSGDAPGPERKAVRWARVYDTLIDARYISSPEDFRGLTQRQVLLFFRQAQYRRNRERAHRIADINAGFAGGKSTTDLINALLKED